MRKKSSSLSSQDSATNSKEHNDVHNDGENSSPESRSCDEDGFVSLKSDRHSDLQQGKFQEVKSVRKQWKKLFVFIISFDKQKGLLEKNTINLIINSLKDYIDYSFNEIKALTENNRLIKEDMIKESQCVVWRFAWTLKNDMYEEIMSLREIRMRTAEIYFRKENRLDRKSRDSFQQRDSYSNGRIATQSQNNHLSNGRGSEVTAPLNFKNAQFAPNSVQTVQDTQNLIKSGNNIINSKQKQLADNQSVLQKSISEKKKRVEIRQQQIAEIRKQNEAIRQEIDQIRERKKLKMIKIQELATFLKEYQYQQQPSQKPESDHVNGQTQQSSSLQSQYSSLNVKI